MDNQESMITLTRAMALRTSENEKLFPEVI